MGVSLAEYMRSVQQLNPTLAGVVEIYAENAPILGNPKTLGVPLPSLGFNPTMGGVVSFTREKTLPTTGFRAIGTEFVASVGVTEPVTESLKIGGGKVEMDRALIARGNFAGAITQQEMMIKAFSRNWNYHFYKGAGTNDSFTGLQLRITGDQAVPNGGGGLDLNLLDKILLNIRGTGQVIAMGAGLMARLGTAAKTDSRVNFTRAEYGLSPAAYAGVPILLAGEDGTDAPVLDFTEVGSSTSLYVLALNDNGVSGVETKPLNLFYPTGRDEVDSPFIVEWDSNFIIKTPRSAYRLSGIIDAAVGSAAPVS